MTTLSGDIGVINNFSDNCYHVVVAAVSPSVTTACTLDGFTVVGGNADNNTSYSVNGIGLARNIGGGIYTRYGTNTIANNTISGNTASAGGGIATIGGPGALISCSNAITNNIISGNTATNGAGLYMVLCTNTLTNNNINGQLGANGAGIYINGGVHIISHNTIDNNAAGSGGGIFMTNGASDTLINNSITNNSSANNGGGVYASSGTTYCINNIFNGNLSGNGGAIFISFDHDDVFANNTFHANNAASHGGALYTDGCLNFQVQNNIFWNNTLATNATLQGADYYENSTPGNTFINNLLQLAGSSYTTSGSGSYDLGTAASGNIFATDPVFVNATDPDGPDNIIRTADDGLRLQPGSPAINAGALSVTSPLTDIIDATRGVAPFDLGAYEWFTCPGNSILYVDASVSASGLGSTWATAFKTLDEALFVAQTCTAVTTINVAAGIYKPAKKPYQNGIEITTPDPRDVCFYLRDGLSLFGGFPPGGGPRNVSANITTLSGDLGVAGNFSDNCYHVVLAAVSPSITPASTIDGFTITGGNANNSSSLNVNTLSVARNLGGGICTRYGANTIAHNTITANEASGGGAGIATIGGPGALMGTSNMIANNIISANLGNNGAGIYMVLCTDTLVNNTITVNEGGSGAGFYANGGTYTISNNTINNNAAVNDGGGAYMTGSTNTLSGNSFTLNFSSRNGGGLYLSSSTSHCSNNVFDNNSSNNFGGAIYTSGFNDIFSNNTIHANVSFSGGGGGLVTDNCVNFLSQNNIFWDNKIGTDATVQGADYMEAGTPGNTFTNNLLQLTNNNYTTSGSGSYDLGTAASGNIFATDPNFLNAADEDGPDNIDRTADDGLRITCNSIATNAGTGNTLTTDILGNTRSGLPDLGAYEANGSVAIDALPSAATVVSHVQTAAVLDYTNCSAEIAKIDGSSPYTISGNTIAKVWIDAIQPSSYVKRHYEITPENNATTATARITLYFTQADFDAFNAINAVKLPTAAADLPGKANLRIYKIGGVSKDGTGLLASYLGNATIIDPIDADIVWNSIASRWEVTFSVTGFSGFFVETSQTVLPLHWLSLKATANSLNQVVITWRVAESNIATYTIEKSTDGIHFISIATVKSKGDGENSYSYDDAPALQGVAYFRVRQTGIDGITSYSPVVKLSSINPAFSVSVYPNPVKNNLTVNAGKGLLGHTAVLTDVSGKILRRIIISQPSFTFDMSPYNDGIYIIRLDNGITEKIIKE